MSGLCLVLETMRQSLDSESESENEEEEEEVEVDGTSSINSRPPSWHGSLQHLTTTSSESEAGNASSEGFLCQQCGRTRRKERTRAAGARPPLLAGRKRGGRPKKRAHFATDTDNSSDPERLSDSLETPLFKPISGPATPSPSFLLSPPLCSLSPREVKAMAFCHDARNSSSHSSSDLGRGRQPFKANHELFKENPGGFPSPPHHHNAKTSTPSSPLPSSPLPPPPPQPAARHHQRSSPASPPDRQASVHGHRFHHFVRRNSLNIDEVIRKAPTDDVTRGNSPFHPRRSLRSQSATRLSQGCRTNDTSRCAQKDFSSRMNDGGRRATGENRDNNDASQSNAGDDDDDDEDDDDDRGLPNYEEAIQRVSLLRWASLQKMVQSSSGQQAGQQTETTTAAAAAAASDPVAKKPGFVRRSVRRLEERAISHSSSSSSSAIPDRSLSLLGSVAAINDEGATQEDGGCETPTARDGGSAVGQMARQVHEKDAMGDKEGGSGHNNFFLAQREDSHESDDVFYSEQSNDNLLLNVSDSTSRRSNSPAADECRPTPLDERPGDGRGGVASRSYVVSCQSDGHKSNSAVKSRKRIILEVLV